MEYQVLKWDSNFFGFKVAYVSLIKTSETELNNLLFLLRQKGFTLVYFSSIVNIDYMDGLLHNYCGKMVDKKNTYRKAIDNNLSIEENIENYKLQFPTSKMLNLAIESGKYSRFNLDKRIENHKYEELYKMWITNSVNHSFAKNVIVYREQEDILGMVTISEKGGIANIGIIAVDKDARGKGIGKSLMKSAEKWAYENSYKNIKVVTQGVNVVANNLYKKLGFSVNKTEYYYHFWLKNNK